MRSSSILVLSDLHGMFYTMVRLLNRAPKGVQVVLAGDLIDRGPHSRKMVDWAMANAIPTCMGNHEDLALAFYHRRAHCRKYYEPRIWLRNGAWETLANWPGPNGDPKTGVIPEAVLSWMEGLPPYLTPSDELDDKGRSLLVSHTGYGLGADEGDWYSTLWARRSIDGPDFLPDKRYRVYGHTQEDVADVRSTFAMIDTGAAYGGSLTGLLWPSKQLIVQPADESLVEASWAIGPGATLL